MSNIRSRKSGNDQSTPRWDNLSHLPSPPKTRKNEAAINSSRNCRQVQSLIDQFNALGNNETFGNYGLPQDNRKKIQSRFPAIPPAIPKHKNSTNLTSKTINLGGLAFGSAGTSGSGIEKLPRIKYGAKDAGAISRQHHQLREIINLPPLDQKNSNKIALPPKKASFGIVSGSQLSLAPRIPMPPRAVPSILIQHYYPPDKPRRSFKEEILEEQKKMMEKIKKMKEKRLSFSDQILGKQKEMALILDAKRARVLAMANIEDEMLRKLSKVKKRNSFPDQILRKHKEIALVLDAKRGRKLVMATFEEEMRRKQQIFKRRISYRY